MIATLGYRNVGDLNRNGFALFLLALFPVRPLAKAWGLSMTIYAGPVFEMAANQLKVVADHLEIPMDERDRLLFPKRAITVPP